MNFRILSAFLFVLLLGQNIFSQAPGSTVTITKNYRDECFVSGVVSSIAVKDAMERMAAGQLGKKTKFSIVVSPGTPDFGADWKGHFLAVLTEVKNAREHKAVEFNYGVQVKDTLPDHVGDADVLMLGEDTPSKMRDVTSGKTIVVLFEFWCGPCRGQAEDLLKIYDTLESSGINVLLLSTESDAESKADLTQLMRDEGYKFKLGWTHGKVFKFFMGYSGFGGIPQVYMFSDRKMLGHFVGGGIRAEKEIKASLNKHWGLKLDQ